jgi:TetR/AcrR family transcriptional repressor of mexJK operon
MALKDFETTGAPSRRPTGGRPTREAIRQRNDRVMGVATALFLERGFAETTLEEIARRAGVAKRTLYNDYTDKEQIFAAVVRARANAAIGAELRCDHAGLTLEEALLGLASEVVALCTAPETVELNRVMIAEAQRFPELIEEITAIGLLDLHSAVARGLKTLAAEGWMSLPDSAVAPAVRFCDIVVGLSALHSLLGVRWTTPDQEELSWRVKLFAAYYGAPAYV